MTSVDRELGELLDFAGGRTRLTTAESDLILATLDAFEEELGGGGWGADPDLYVIRGRLGALGAMVGVGLRRVPVPAARWGPDPGATLDRIAEAAMRSPAAAKTIAAVAGDRPLLGLAWATEGWQRKRGADVARSVHDHPELREDEVRIVAAVDLDERQYHAIRFRRTGIRHLDVRTSQRADRELDAATDADVRWMHETHEEGIPRGPRALRQIVRAICGTQ